MHNAPMLPISTAVRLIACAVAMAGLLSCSLPQQQAPEPAAATPARPATPPGPEGPAPASAGERAGTQPGVPPAPASPAAATAAPLTLANARRVQSEVMDFTDDMTIRLIEAIDQIELAAPSIESRVMAHRLKYTVAHGATIIAAAQNPRIALVDMLVMVSLQETLLNQNIVPKYFGPESARLVQIFDESEREIRRLAAATLTPEQLAEVDAMILRWLGANADRYFAAYVRLSDFAEARQIAAAQAGGGRPSNVLGFLFIDPLSGLDPTTRELEQTRLFAERALYYLQRAPMLVSWQAELLFIDTVSEPEIRQLVGNAGTVTEAVARVSAEVAGLREQIPALLAEERRAAIEQAGVIIDEQRQAAIAQAIAGLREERIAVIDQLAAEQERLGQTVTQLQSTIDAGTTLSDSLRLTTGSVSDLATQLRLGEEGDPNDEPFRIQDYTLALQEATRAAEELGRLAASLTGATDPAVLNARLDLVEQRLVTAEDTANRLVDRVFALAMRLVIVLLIGLLVVLVVGSALGAAAGRLVRRRLARKAV